MFAMHCGSVRPFCFINDPKEFGATPAVNYVGISRSGWNTSKHAELSPTSKLKANYIKCGCDGREGAELELVCLDLPRCFMKALCVSRPVFMNAVILRRTSALPFTSSNGNQHVSQPERSNTVTGNILSA